MAELLDEIDNKMKNRLVGELLKGKRSTLFKTTDVIKRYEQLSKEEKSKVSIDVNVKADEGTSAKISKVEKTGEGADVAINTQGYVGQHQYAM